jgi:hypothetical protein
MGEPVNLNRHRKRKRREREQKQADANRAWHGATKAERARLALERRRQARRLEGHRREPEEE